MSILSTFADGNMPPQHARLQASVATGALDGWDAAWKENWTPWDAAGPQTALKWAIHYPVIADYLPVAESPALVAGMGRGYDTAFLAEQGYNAVGVDISSTAVDAAIEWRDGNVPEDLRSRIRLHVQDFFALGTGKADATILQSFGLAYDYTFLCALHPTMRQVWAETYARVIRPGGVLLALVFPIEGDRPGGPPFSVSPELYKKLLGESFELVWEGVPFEQSEKRAGTQIELIHVWRRR